MAGQEAVRFYFDFVAAEFHGKRRSEVDEVCITYVWEKDVGKALREFIQNGLKAGFPEVIDEV